MYRDDQCPVCGEALPPDHLYCREHAAEVDERLHEIGDVLARLADDVPRLASLLPTIASETWDWLAEEVAGDDELEWPPAPPMTLHVHADEVEVDVDSSPGRVRIDLTAELRTVLEAVAEGLGREDLKQLVAACRAARDAGATH